MPEWHAQSQHMKRFFLKRIEAKRRKVEDKVLDMDPQCTRGSSKPATPGIKRIIYTKLEEGGYECTYKNNIYLLT